MKQLITGTTAYRSYANDAATGRLSHAYMLHLNDAVKLRAVLKIFALRFFGLSGDEVDGKRLLNETLTDCRIYPEEGKKLNAEAVGELLADSVLRPVEHDVKLFIVSGFNEASALLQNKLLKTLEEPPAGVYFLLGITSPSSVLDTVKSRVKTLTVPPFTSAEILSALQRRGDNELNLSAAESCGGILGVAENMVDGGWFGAVAAAAEEICTTSEIGRIGAVAAKYGDTKYKTELLAQISLSYYNALREKACGARQGKVARVWSAPALAYAVESADKAAADVKFNAFFQGLLYDLMLRIIEENDRWLKLQA